MAPSYPIRIAFVGTGYIADSYRTCLDLHRPEVELVGVWDRDGVRARSFADTWGDRVFDSLEDLLGTEALDIVVNLTDPHAHFEVSQRILEAGHHLYTEKPLAMTAQEAEQLRDLAAAKGLRVASAPCNMLSEAAQTLWRAVREQRVGKVRLVYAELDDGMIHRIDRGKWLSRSGKPWPAAGEFSVGCTFEHAGYVLTILAAMFGPVEEVTAFSALCLPDKDVPVPHHGFAPDMSVGCLRFANGVVARLTNSIVAPYDHRLRVIGEDGVLTMPEIWDYASPVRFMPTSVGRIARYLDRKFSIRLSEKVPLVRACPVPRRGGGSTMDFMRGVRELGDAIIAGRPSRLDANFAVHITEVTEILQYPERFSSPARVKSRFDPIAPMPWAV